MDSIHPNINVLKEPVAFIKFLQILMAILAFATTCGYSNYVKFSVKCKDGQFYTKQFSFAYPFNLGADSDLTIPLCPDPSKTDIQTKFEAYGNYMAPSQFFVFVGVMAFLYCIAALVCYIFFSNHYESNHIIPKVDFGITTGFTALWFICSVAWADGTTKLREYTELERIFNELTRKYQQTNADLTPITEADYASLYVSLICGFTNIVLWGAGMWFVWKETAWFGDKVMGGKSAPSMEPPPQQTPQSNYQPDGSQI